MILLIELRCEHGHENAGAAVEWSGPEEMPTREWVEDHTKAFLKHASADPVLAHCLMCHAPQSGAWTIHTGVTTFQSVADAERDIYRIQGRYSAPSAE